MRDDCWNMITQILSILVRRIRAILPRWSSTNAPRIRHGSFFLLKTEPLKIPLPSKIQQNLPSSLRRLIL
jgi:hypothetical protein